MTTTDPTSVEEASSRWTSQAMRIAFTAMAVCLICVSISAVLVTINETSTQRNADSATREAEQLRTELQCRAVPALAYDRESSKLDAMIAEGLAAIALGEFDDPVAFADALTSQVAVVEAALDAREKSLEDCSV